MPITIDGDAVSGITIDGETVTEVTVDGDVVWTATTATVIENWEEGTLPAAWSGSTSEMTVQSSVVDAGPYALEGSTGAFSSIVSSTGDGLNYYPVSGDTIQWAFRVSSGFTGVTQFRFGRQDGSNNYEVRIGWDFSTNFNDDWEIRKQSGGSWTKSDAPANPMNKGQWYHGRVYWDTDGSGDIVAECYNFGDFSSPLATATITDTEYTSGGLELIDNSDGNAVYTGDILSV